MRRLLVLLAGALCIAAATPRHSVRSVSTDGEATIYLTADFSRGFNVAYNAVLPQSAGNRSTTFLSVMLVGRRFSGGSIAFGLTRGAPAQALQIFVATTTPHGAHHYATFPAACLPACTLVLRGDRYGLYAFAVTAEATRKLGAWARADFDFTRPYVQLNGEVATPGDRMVATLVPMRLVADARDVPAPRCAFTTRGIIPRREPSGALDFRGTYRPQAPASFVDLRTGKSVDRCP